MDEFFDSVEEKLQFLLEEQDAYREEINELKRERQTNDVLDKLRTRQDEAERVEVELRNTYRQIQMMSRTPPRSPLR